MPLYEISQKALKALEPITFEAAGIKERADLQRLFREQVAVIAPETLIIAEEFCDWEDSKRRVDLLGIDKSANIVVVERNRTEDGGHMDPQAVRYAAMVSAFTFERAVEVYRGHLARMGSPDDARARLREFLRWDSADEEEFGQAVRIVLVSAEFSRELTTSVIWLNSQGLDVRCVRLRPYRQNSTTVLGVQQVVPLPEAADYQVQLRQKVQQAKQERSERHDLRHRFLAGLLARAKARTQLHGHVTVSGEAGWVGVSAGISGAWFNYVTHQHEGRIEMYMDRVEHDSNKKLFDALHAQRAVIEGDFAGSLLWERLNEKRACRISATTSTGGYRDDEQIWPGIQDEMINLMIRFECALRPHLKVFAANG